MSHVYLDIIAEVTPRIIEVEVAPPVAVVIDVVTGGPSIVIVEEVFRTGPRGDPGEQGPPGEVEEAPDTGQLYARQSGQWQDIVRITVGATAPVSPAVNEVWIDTST